MVVQPFRFKAVFDDFIRNAVVFRSRMASNGFMNSFMADSARTLGRQIESFGEKTWLLDKYAFLSELPKSPADMKWANHGCVSPEWIVEKAVLRDMFECRECTQQ
ncbi:hypothetical protein HJFPF1_02477 [Paramyrothecium foliicola]|nr:hypothetical protein HJFPF1_02477 [Paramyrothecium foliicola]